MDVVCFAVLVIHRTTRELEQLGDEGRCVRCRDVLGAELQDKLFLELPILAHHGVWHLDLHIFDNRVRHILEPVGGSQGDRDVRDSLLNGLLGVGIRCPVVLHVVGRVEVGPLEHLEVGAESFAVIEQSHLREQVEQAVGCRGACERDAVGHFIGVLAEPLTQAIATLVVGCF